MSIVNYDGLSKAEVLAALFNASRPMGMGVLQAGFGPEVMSVEHAEGLINGDIKTNDYAMDHGLYFDYVYGRPLKINLRSDENTFESFGFDRDNGGEGTAQRIIDSIRGGR